MNKIAVDALRLSWRYAREGRSGPRDLFLTLAVAESGLKEAVWAERCRRWLGRARPGHPFGKYPTLGASLADPRFADDLERLRLRYPPSRIRWLLECASRSDAEAFGVSDMRIEANENAEFVPEFRPAVTLREEISALMVESMANEIVSQSPRLGQGRMNHSAAGRDSFRSLPTGTIAQIRIVAARRFSMKSACATAQP